MKKLFITLSAMLAFSFAALPAQAGEWFIGAGGGELALGKDLSDYREALGGNLTGGHISGGYCFNSGWFCLKGFASDHGRSRSEKTTILKNGEYHLTATPQEVQEFFNEYPELQGFVDPIAQSLAESYGINETVILPDIEATAILSADVRMIGIAAEFRHRFGQHFVGWASIGVAHLEGTATGRLTVEDESFSVSEEVSGTVPHFSLGADYVWKSGWFLRGSVTAVSEEDRIYGLSIGKSW